MVDMAEPTSKMIETGVPNLDRVLGGGLQQHNSYIIVGTPGTGKSILSQQIAFHRAKQGDRILFITGLDEPHRNLLEHWRSLRFADLGLVGPQIETVSLVPFLDQPVSEKINVLRRTVLNARPAFVILDGLRSYEVYAGGAKDLHEFIYGLTSWFAVEGITLITTRDTDAGVGHVQSELSLFDGAWVMSHDPVRSSAMGRLWIEKMRGQRPLRGLHSYSIDENGVTVWPRPQAEFTLEDQPWSQTRLGLGVATLDGMLNGGLPERTCTLLTGDPGAGQASLALSFLNEGLRQGQPGLWLGFHASPSRLLGASQQWAGELADAAAGGRVRFLSMAPFEQDANHLAAQVQQAIAEMAPQRMVLDSADALARAVAGGEEAAGFVAWLSRALPQQGVTVLITQESSQPYGNEFDISGQPLASLLDNVIIVCRIRRKGPMRTVVAVAKMSIPGFDQTIRELNVDQSGISIGEPLADALEVPQPAL